MVPPKTYIFPTHWSLQCFLIFCRVLCFETFFERILDRGVYLQSVVSYLYIYIYLYMYILYIYIYIC